MRASTVTSTSSMTMSTAGSARVTMEFQKFKCDARLISSWSSAKSCRWVLVEFVLNLPHRAGRSDPARLRHVGQLFASVHQI